MLQIQNLTKSFALDDGYSVRALDNLALEVLKGELIVLMGPNGSGKSTLFRILSGQTSADCGDIFLDGHHWEEQGRRGSNGFVAHVPQEPKALAFPEMTLEEHLLWSEMSGSRARFWARGVTQPRRARYHAILEQYQLHPLADALNRPLRSLSVGWQQVFVVFMTAVARKLSEQKERTPGLLLLDEPTSALDAENARICLDLVKTLHCEGRTILIATHDLELAIEMAERLYVLRKGRIIADLSRAEITQLGTAGMLPIVSGSEFRETHSAPL